MSTSLWDLRYSSDVPYDAVYSGSSFLNLRCSGCCFLDLLVDPEDGDNIVIQNFGELLPDYTASYHHTQENGTLQMIPWPYREWKPDSRARSNPLYRLSYPGRRLYFVNTLWRVWVAIDGVWIGDWIYWTLLDHNVNVEFSLCLTN
jgi:hypothetical protein